MNSISMIKKIYHLIRNKYYKVVTFYKISTTNRHNRIWLLNTPDHGNIGDQAIFLAEIKFLKDSFKDFDVVELTARQWQLSKEYIVKNVKEGELVLIHGGGYIGDLWPGAERMAREIITTLSSNRIIMLQNTIFYNHPEDEKNLLFYREHSVTLFLRDIKSYNIAKKYFEEDNVYLLPDTVLYLDKRSKRKRKNQVLVCLRNDVEKIDHGELVNRIIRCAEKEHMKVVYTDMLWKHEAIIGFRSIIVRRKWAQFQQSKIVITDRLHGMYFSAITGTYCMVLDNVSGKVRGGYEVWLKDCPNVEWLIDEEWAGKNIEQLEHSTKMVPDLNFEVMEKIIRVQLNKEKMGE